MTEDIPFFVKLKQVVPHFYDVHIQRRLIQLKSLLLQLGPVKLTR